MVEVEIKKLSNSAKIPVHGSKEAAGYDLYADITEDFVEIAPHSTVKIPTGVAMAIPDGYFGGIFARSGLCSREGLRPCQGVAVIDQDYRGEIIVPIHNDTDTVRFINKHDRIAQLVIIPYLTVHFKEVDKLNTTSRGTGGFGSTGTK